MSIAAAHWYTIKGYAFALDRLHELHEGRCAHHRHGLSNVAAEIHAAKATAQCLLRQYIALGRIGTKPYDDGNVSDIPAFLQHQDRHDGLVGRFPTVDFV